MIVTCHGLAGLQSRGCLRVLFLKKLGGPRPLAEFADKVMADALCDASKPVNAISNLKRLQQWNDNPLAKPGSAIIFEFHQLGLVHGESALGPITLRRSAERGHAWR